MILYPFPFTQTMLCYRCKRNARYPTVWLDQSQVSGKTDLTLSTSCSAPPPPPVISDIIMSGITPFTAAIGKGRNSEKKVHKLILSRNQFLFYISLFSYWNHLIIYPKKKDYTITQWAEAKKLWAFLFQNIHNMQVQYHGNISSSTGKIHSVHRTKQKKRVDWKQLQQNHKSN